MVETASLVIKVDSSSAKRATTDLERLTKEGGRAESKIGALGKAFSVLGGGVLVGKFLGAVISNTVEAEKVQAQLAARLKSTQGAANLALGELNNMAKGLQNVTTYGDEAIGTAQSLLLTFTKIGKDVFPDTLEVVLDMSTALGTDLKESAIQVGKALQDPVLGITALRRVGVNFSQAQTDVIKKLVETGQQAEAQRLILKELQTEFGGSARAARDTLGGALTALKEKFGDLLEGDTGGDGVRGARKAIEDFIGVLNDPQVQQGFQQFIQGLFGIASAASEALGVLAKLYAQQAKQFGFSEDKHGGTRNVTASEGISAFGKGIKALLSGDYKEAQRLSDLAYKGAFGGRVAVDPITPIFAGDGNEPSGFFRRGANAGSTDTGSTDTGNGNGNGNGRRRVALPDFSKEDEAALRRAVEAAAAANDQFDALAATLAGPLAEAEYQHQQNLKQIDELTQQSGRSTEEANKLKQQETQRYEEERKQIEAQLDPAKQLLEHRRNELELLSKTNAERQTAIDLLYLEGKATRAQKDEMLALNKAYEEQSKSIDLQNEFRRGFSGLFTDIIDGSKSAKDALKSFFDSLNARILDQIANNLTSNLFGQQGQNGGGQFGGLLSSFFSLFGGGSANGNVFSNGSMVTAFANGGVVGSPTYFPMSGGRAGLMGEDGPEAVVPLKRGSDGKLGIASSGKSQTNNITINVQPKTERHSAMQIALETARELQLSTARS